MKIQGYEVDLDKDSTREFLRNCHFRKGKAWFGSQWEVFYNGKWLGLSRTDLKDDVGIGCPKDQYSIEGLMRLCAYGARVKENSFCVITRYSDG